MSRKIDKSPLSRIAGTQPAIRHITAAYPADNTNENTNNNTIRNESDNENIVVSVSQENQETREYRQEVITSDNFKNTIENKSRNESVNEIATKSTSQSAMNDYIAKNRKQKFEDLHTKDTYWVDNNILLTLREITSGNKGLKTKIINDSLRAFFKKQGIKIKNEE
jgi:hypothetical protein